MTFDEWMLIKDKSYVPTDDSMQLRLLRECWFSRDAEIAELVAALEKQVAHDKAVSYERCPDCDYGQKCSRESGCRDIKNHSPIASAALAKVRKP